MSNPVVVYRAEDATGTTVRPYVNAPAAVREPVPVSGDFFRFEQDQDQDLNAFSPASLSADMELSQSRTRNNARVRALLRRDAYLQNAVNLARDICVGSQWVLDHTPNYHWLCRGAGWTPEAAEQWAKDHAREVETLFQPYAYGLDHCIDVTEKTDLVGLMRQCASTARLYGEVFAVVERVDRPNRAYQTALRLPDPDRIRNAYQISNGWTVWNGQRCRLRDGVVFAEDGHVVGYQVSETHENDYWDPNFGWQEVAKVDSASRLQAMLFQDTRRPEQSRGASDLWTCIRQCKVLMKLQNAELGRAIMNAVYAATLESDMPPDLMAKVMSDSNQDAMKALAGFLEVQRRFLGGGNGASFGGNKLISLFMGQKLKITSPSSSNGATGTEFEKSVLRHIATAGGVTLEELTGDLSNTNYSSIKAGQADTNMKAESLRGAFLYPTAQLIFQSWYEEAYSLGHFQETINRVRNLPDLYAPGALSAYTQCAWTPSARSPVDMLKEMQGLALAWKSGIYSFKDVCAYLGKDPRQQLSQMSQEIKDFKAAGVPHIMMLQNPTMSALTPGVGDAKDAGDGTEKGQAALGELLSEMAERADMSEEAVCAALVNMQQSRNGMFGAFA